MFSRVDLAMSWFIIHIMFMTFGLLVCIQDLNYLAFQSFEGRRGVIVW
jgi:predicted solute-binding protein